MTSRAESAPTAAELLVWTQVAAPMTAHGVFRRSGTAQSDGVGWTAFGAPPVFVDVPVDVPVHFWHRHHDAWRLQIGGELLAVSDGRRSVAWNDGGEETGGSLLMPKGPSALLRPGTLSGGYDERLPTGPIPPIERADLLGRRAWRWHSQGVTSWVDEETGCCLRTERAGEVLELEEFEVGVPLDDALFDVPELGSIDVSPYDEAHWAHDNAVVEVDRRQARADFTVTWWPYGALSYPLSGDASDPEVLLSLMQHTHFYLGVAPWGRRPATVPGCAVREWTGDGWAFALSWRGDVAADDIDRIVASVPERWA